MFVPAQAVCNLSYVIVWSCILNTYVNTTFAYKLSLYNSLESI